MKNKFKRCENCKSIYVLNTDKYDYKSYRYDYCEQCNKDLDELISKS